MIVPSQKQASDRFDIREVDPTKIFSRADARMLGAGLQYLFEATRGLSFGTSEGSSSGINDLSVISATNYTNYQEEIMQAIQTCVANKNLLTVDPSSTTNGLILTNRYIDNETTVSGINEAKTTSFPFRFRNGLELDFVAIANNTGAVTISIPNFLGVSGALNVLKQDLTPCISGDIKAGYRYTIICDKTNNRVILKDTFVREATTTKQGAVYLPTGVQLTYASSTTLTYKILDSDSINEISNGTINLGAVGVDGLDTGSLQANTTYHIFQIKNLTSNLTKTVTSSSLSSPTLPSGFTVKKHVFSFKTNGSSQLRPMTIFNIGNNQYYVSYTNVIEEYASTVVASTGTNLQLTVPSGVPVEAFLGLRRANISSGNVGIGVAPPHVSGDVVTVFNVWFGGSSGTHDGGNEAYSFTDTNGTVKVFGKSDTTPTNLAVNIFTKGYYLYL